MLKNVLPHHQNTKREYLLEELIIPPVECNTLEEPLKRSNEAVLETGGGITPYEHTLWCFFLNLPSVTSSFSSIKKHQ